MSRGILVSIVQGPAPSHKHPLPLERIEALARSRDDVRLRFGDSGTRSTRDREIVDPTGKARGVLTLIDGRLQARGPDDATLEWMLDLARQLNARVVDATRRTYRTPHETFIHADDIAARQGHANRIRAARSAWRPTGPTLAKWILLVAVLAAAVAVGLLS